LASPRLQQAKHVTCAKHYVNWNGTVTKNSGTNVVFQIDVFFIPGIKITKGPQASIAKPVTAFPKFVYITINY